MRKGNPITSLLGAVAGVAALMTAPVYSQEAPVSPGQVNAGPGNGDVVWLILRTGLTATATVTAIPMKSMEQCEMSGAEFRASKRFMRQMGNDLRGFECLEGIR